MSKLPANRAAQFIFIGTGLLLIILTIFIQLDLSVIPNEVIIIGVVAVMVMYVIYMLYLGIMAIITGKYPHDRAVLIFPCEQKSGLTAKLSGFILVLFGCYSISMFITYAAYKHENSILQQSIQMEIERDPLSE